MDHVARPLIRPWFLSDSKLAVIPAKAGIHFALGYGNEIKMDSRFRGNDELSIRQFSCRHAMRSVPPMYGCNTFGTAIEPSSCW